jgi:hypothetical protein
LGAAIIAKDGAAPRGLTIYGYVGPAAYLDAQLNRDYLDKLASDRPIAILTVSGQEVRQRFDGTRPISCNASVNILTRTIVRDAQ